MLLAVSQVPGLFDVFVGLSVIIGAVALVLLIIEVML